MISIKNVIKEYLKHVLSDETEIKELKKRLAVLETELARLQYAILNISNNSTYRGR